LENGLAGLEDGIAKAIESGDVFAKAAAQDLVPLVQQAKDSGDEVRYGGGESAVYGHKGDECAIEVLRRNCIIQQRKTDLYAMFIERGGRIVEGDWLQQHGYDARLDVLVLVR
jgi:hypothetical protein